MITDEVYDDMYDYIPGRTKGAIATAWHRVKNVSGSPVKSNSKSHVRDSFERGFANGVLAERHNVYELLLAEGTPEETLDKIASMDHWEDPRG